MGSINSNKVGFNQKRHAKARIAKKYLKTAQKHREGVKRVSGARTGKHQRKLERKLRRDAKDKETKALKAASSGEDAKAASDDVAPMAE